MTSRMAVNVPSQQPTPDAVEITVIKKGTLPKPGFRRAYVGRGTALGNPFSHLAHSRAELTVRSRDEAVDAFGVWLGELLGEGETVNAPVLALMGQLSAGELERRRWAAREQLNAIYVLGTKGHLELECFCVPERCHGEHVK